MLRKVSLISALTELSTISLISTLAESHLTQAENWGDIGKDIWEVDRDSHLDQGKGIVCTASKLLKKCDPSHMDSLFVI